MFLSLSLSLSLSASLIFVGSQFHLRDRKWRERGERESSICLNLVGSQFNLREIEKINTDLILKTYLYISLSLSASLSFVGSRFNLRVGKDREIGERERERERERDPSCSILLDPEIV
jgi:hypothetical protein